MHEVWDSPKGEAYPLKLPLNLSTGKVSHWKAKEKFDYKTNYKNHSWPNRKQSLQLEGKGKQIDPGVQLAQIQKNTAHKSN